MRLPTDRRYYIAGPMTGHPQFNVPLFRKVAAALRAAGLEVVSPAELDSLTMQAAAWESKTGDMADLAAFTDETWGDVLARDVKVISDELDDIVLLPAWTTSRGAVLEATVGLLQPDTRFYLWAQSEGSSPDIRPVTREWVATGVGHALVRRANERGIAA